MLNSIRTLFQCLEQNGIIYCHWKSNEHLTEALNGDTDLDVLFLPEQRSHLDKVLNECGMKRFRSTPMMQYNAIEDYIGFDEDEAKIWHLHTHYRMTLGEKHLKGYTVTHWGKYILDNRIKDQSGIYVCSPNVEIVLLLSRIALKKRIRDFGRPLGQDDISEYEWLLRRTDPDLIKKHSLSLCGKKASIIICELCERKLKNKSELNELFSVLRSELSCFTGYTSLESRIVRTKREINWLIGGIKRRLGVNTTSAYRRVSPSGGAVVVFLGCDGAGKSTSLTYVKREFGKKLDVYTSYLGSGDGSSSLIRKPMKLIAKRVGGKGLGHSVDIEYAEKKKISFKSRVYSIAKILWAIALAKEKKEKFKKITMARNNGILVLVDRYPQISMPGCNDGPLLSRYLKEGSWLTKRIAKWEYSVYESVLKNCPDLTLKLMVPTEVAIIRKPEMTEVEIENKKKAVRNMNIGLRSVEIDTSQELTVSLSQIMKEIWKVV